MKKSKAEILSECSQVRSDLLAIAADLPDASWGQVFLGSWSVKELLAHLAGWDYANLEAAQAILRGLMPAFYAFIDKDWRSFNDLLVQQYGRQDRSVLLQQLSDSHQALMEGLDAIPEGDFARDFGLRANGWKVTIARLIEIETKEERQHLEQIRTAFFDPPRLAVWYFNRGFCCSQAVLKTFAPRFEMSDEQASRLAAPFGSGMGRQGEVCGALSGALMVIGLRYGNSLSEDKIAKEKAYLHAAHFLEQFKARSQSIFCRDLLGLDLSQPDDFNKAHEQKAFERICPQYIQQAVEILLPILDE